LNAKVHLTDGPESRVLTVPPPEPPEARPAVPASSRIPARRLAALGVAGLGLAGIATGSAFGLSARSTWNDAVTNHCPALPVCDPTGVREAGDAKQAANVSTVAFGVGLAALGAAAALWWTAAPAATPTSGSTARISAAMDAHGPGFVVQGTF
jgi:hypothetical protein